MYHGEHFGVPSDWDWNNAAPKLPLRFYLAQNKNEMFNFTYIDPKERVGGGALENSFKKYLEIY